MLIKNPPDRKPSGPSNKRAIRWITKEASSQCGWKRLSLTRKAFLRLRRLPEALEEARRALELDPGQSIARLARAMAMQQSGRAKDAEVELRDLLRRNPQDSEVCVLLGYLQLCSGNSSVGSPTRVASRDRKDGPIHA
eukprot:g17975.t1